MYLKSGKSIISDTILAVNVSEKLENGNFRYIAYVGPPELSNTQLINQKYDFIFDGVCYYLIVRKMLEVWFL